MGAKQSSPCKFVTNKNEIYYLTDKDNNIAYCKLDNDNREFNMKPGCTFDNPCIGEVRDGVCMINNKDTGIKCASQEINGGFLPVIIPENISHITQYFNNNEFKKGILNKNRVANIMSKEINQRTGQPYVFPDDFEQFIDEYDIILGFISHKENIPENSNNKEVIDKVLSMIDIVSLPKKSMYNVPKRTVLYAPVPFFTNTLTPSQFLPGPVASPSSTLEISPSHYSSLSPTSLNVIPQKTIFQLISSSLLSDNTLLWICIGAFILIFITVFTIFIMRFIRISRNQNTLNVNSNVNANVHSNTYSNPYSNAYSNTYSNSGKRYRKMK